MPCNSAGVFCYSQLIKNISTNSQFLVIIQFVSVLFFESAWLTRVLTFMK